MTMQHCEDCQTPINAEAQPECHVDVGNMRRLTQYIWLCELCQEKRYDAEDAAAGIEPEGVW